MMNATNLQKYLFQWDLTLEEKPLQTQTGLIAKVKWRKQSCILKIAREEGDERTASVLKHYEGHGAVRLLQEEGCATLLERAMPGTHLSEPVLKGQDEQASHILCDVIEKLHSHRTTLGTYPSILNFNVGFTRYLNSGNSQIPHDLVREAQFLYDQLIASQSIPILLHGDLHHDNVLYDETRGWLAIDPKGYVGDPAYEVGAFLRNPMGYHQNPEFIKRRVDIVCSRLGFEQNRVIAWAFSQAILASIWSVEDGQSPEWFVELALSYKKHFIKELDIRAAF
ncbi:MAG: phosphotransferase [Alphaproteobacteria bacterium]|nr:phosphotransferase [Alphaproteobacteria bacterium]